MPETNQSQRMIRRLRAHNLLLSGSVELIPTNANKIRRERDGVWAWYAHGPGAPERVMVGSRFSMTVLLKVPVWDIARDEQDHVVISPCTCQPGCHTTRSDWLRPKERNGS